MPTPTPRLSEDAHAAWVRVQKAHGVTLTGLYEALGLMLHDKTWTLPPEAIDRARLVDHERRTNRRRSSGA
jgi:hypothetical protein